MVCGSYGLGQTGLTGEPVKGIREGDVDGIHVIEIVLPYSNYQGLVRRSLVFMKYSLRSIGIAWRTDYDLLFATSTPLTAGIPGIAMRFLKPRRTFVFEVRDLWPELPKAMGVVTNPIILAGMSLLEWMSYACAHSCIGLSPGIAEGIGRRSRRGKPIAMIPNGCDLDLFGGDTTPSPGRRDSSPAGFRAVFTGAHGIANGLDAVLDAARVLKERHRDDIEILFVGDGKLKPALVECAEAEKLDNCRFLDPMPKTELCEFMREADVGLMVLANVPAFYYGTSPNKFFDYIAARMPVVNNYPGWLADMIKEHDCGIAVPPGDPVAFADALIELADNPENRTAMGKKARRLAETSFGREDLARQFVDFLESATE